MLVCRLIFIKGTTGTVKPELGNLRIMGRTLSVPIDLLMSKFSKTFNNV